MAFLGLLLFLFLYRLHPAQEEPTPSIEALASPTESNILRPGKFVGPAGYFDQFAVPTKDYAIFEPDGEGTLHDTPYVIIPNSELISNGCQRRQVLLRWDSIFEHAE